MRQGCSVVTDTEPLRAAFEKMRNGECSTLPVMRDGRLVGLLTLENVGELVMVSEAGIKFKRSS